MKHLLIALARIHQYTISPALHALCGPGCGCRHEPTCSNYFIGAVGTHGAWRGLLLGLARLARCHPWGGSGWDPVPPAPTRPPKQSNG